MKLCIPILIYLIIASGCESNRKPSTTSSEPKSVAHSIDHIIFAINNLDSGMAQFKRLTGISPVFGGQHPGRGSHNALVSFGETTYLEIIAPRLDVDSSEAQYSAYLHDFETLTPMGWAVTSADTTRTKKRLMDLGFPVSGFESGGREKPNGEKLAWTTFGIEEQIAGLPFFIHWHKGTPHPATTSPSGSTISEVVIRSPDHQQLKVLMEGLKLPVTIDESEETTMKLVVEVGGKTVTFE